MVNKVNEDWSSENTKWHENWTHWFLFSAAKCVANICISLQSIAFSEIYTAKDYNHQ